jgi:hypothetical protein
MEGRPQLDAGKGESVGKKRVDIAAVFRQLALHEEAPIHPWLRGRRIAMPCWTPSRGWRFCGCCYQLTQPMIAGEVQEELEIPGSTLSHHFGKIETSRIEQCEARRNVFTDKFAGIRPRYLPAFVLAQILGASAAFPLFR